MKISASLFKTRTLLATALLLSIASLTQAADIVTWNTAGNLGTETAEPAATVAVGLFGTNLTLGPGITAAANGNRFGGRNWFDSGDTVAGTTLTESISGNDYIEFIISPDNATFTATGLRFIFDRSATGPNSLALRSSLDNYANNLAQVTGLSTTTSTFTSLTFGGVTDVSTATTFRLYGFGATDPDGTGGFDTTSTRTTPNVVLEGSVTAVPEPSTWIGAGLILGIAGWSQRKRPQGTKAS
jgi:hypothetical protein